MENVLKTVKSKVKTTKVLAIIGAVLIILGLFFNVGKLTFKVDKDAVKAEIKEQSGNYVSDSEISKMIDSRIDSLNSMAKSQAVEETSMNYWGGYVMLILAILAVGLVFIDFIEKKVPADKIAKISFWSKLKNTKLICLLAVVILVIMVATWKMPLKKGFADETGLEYKEVSERLDSIKEYFLQAKYKIGTGLIFVVLGSVSLAAYPLLYKPEDKVQEAVKAEEEPKAEPEPTSNE